MTKSERAAYNQGRNARGLSKDRSANPFVRMTNLWSWWMAGWGDADIAAGRAGVQHS